MILHRFDEWNTNRPLWPLARCFGVAALIVLIVIGALIWCCTFVRNVPTEANLDSLLALIGILGGIDTGLAIAALWHYEEAKLKARKDTEKRIAELEREVGIGG